MNHYRTILLFGGTSEERKVSVATAQNIAGALENAQFWFVNPKGEIFLVSKEQLTAHQNSFLMDFLPTSSSVAKNFEEALHQIDPKTVFYFGLHGGEGENGKLQALLEKRNIPFTASGSKASYQAFEKGLSKEVAKKHGVLVANGIEFCTTDSQLEQLLLERFEGFGPQVLKPVDEGSSIGLFFLQHLKEVGKISSALRNFGERRYLCESLIEGTELTVGVVNDGQKNIALPSTEIRIDRNRNFDYAGKYLGKGVKEITPAEISKEDEEKCQKLSVKMHEALGCYGYTRTDMILTREGPYYLETNTLPGLTKASLVPQQLEAAKISFKSFIQCQLDLAVKRLG